jgi:cytochrome c55X
MRSARILALLTLLTLLPLALMAAPDSARRQELLYLLKQDCGSCHGLTLKGGLGPALLPSMLRGKPVNLLAATILDGRPGSAMPPWRGMISEDEARWLAKRLKEGVK